MSAVRGLQSYITRTAAARERVYLGNKQNSSSGGGSGGGGGGGRSKRRSRPRLLCDFTPVAQWLLSSCDARLVRSGQLSPHFILYGGDLVRYRERIVAFIRGLKHVGVGLVFFMESVPGVILEDFEMEVVDLQSWHEQLVKRSASVYQVCEGIESLLQVPWHLDHDAVLEVVRALKCEGVPLRLCPHGTTTEMIGYQCRHRSVLGALSSNTDLALAAGSKFFPLDSFDLKDGLGLASSDICTQPDTVVCEWVSRSTLCSSLQLPNESSLVDVSILCGNRFTAKLNERCSTVRNLQLLGSSFEEVANLVSNLDPNQWASVVEELQNDIIYCEAIGKSFQLYDPQENWRESQSPVFISGPKSEHSAVLKVESKLENSTLAAIGNGVYWRWPLLEPRSLSQPCFSDLSLPIRKKIYSILDKEDVWEYGSTSSKSFGRIFVKSGGEEKMNVFQMSNIERLVALFLLVPPATLSGQTIQQDDVATEVDKLNPELLSGLSSVVLICAGLRYLQHLAYHHGYHLESRDIQALLVTCLFCSAQFPPLIVPKTPSTHTLSVAMLFSHILEQIRLMASSLSVADSLPPPSLIFYPMAFIPHSMSTAVVEGDSSTNLKEVFANSQRVLNQPEVKELLEEVENNWQQMSLGHSLTLFSNAKHCIENQDSFIFKESALSPHPPPLLELVFQSALRGERFEAHTITSDCESEAFEMDYYYKEEYEDMNDEDVVGTPAETVGNAASGQTEEEEEEEEGGNDGVKDGEQCPIENGEVKEDQRKGKEENEGDMEEEGGGDGGMVGRELRAVSEGSIPESDVDLPLKSPAVAGDEEEIHSPYSSFSSASSSSSSSCSPTPFSSSSVHDYTPPVSSPHTKNLSPADLPIAAHRTNLLELIENNLVVCIEGETGCGKSTRVPQYILDHALSQSPPQHCHIIITQPRRMAAVKLAERVANERGEAIGHTVGYCVGGESTNQYGVAITYCTTGYLLQALIHNPDLISRYTHIILDEIHERCSDADFNLLVVRELLQFRGPHVKLIIMSATMETSLVVEYLQQKFEKVAGPYFVGAKNYGVNTYFIDDVGRLPANPTLWNSCQKSALENIKTLAENRPAEMSVSALSARPTVTNYAMKVCTEVVVSQACRGESILIFLPGYNEISVYYEQLQNRLSDLGVVDHFRVFVLHSQVPIEDQREAFVDPPPSVVHVILATNIAESSITLPKLRIVINFGIRRQLQYNSKRRISCLVKCWCSQASCVQRAGRAGRVCVGTVVHLFTRRFFNIVLPPYDPPEILTSPITKLVLQAKQIGRKIGHPSPSDFLSLAITPPQMEQLDAALQDLARLGAIESYPHEEVDEEAEIMFLGHFSLTLPVDLELSRLVLFGVLFGCAADAVVIASSMSLQREVLSLPCRVIMKSDDEFRESLGRSFKNRSLLDGDCYSDAVIMCNVFKRWLEYRRNHKNSNLPKHVLARNFSKSNACRMERLLQLEVTVGEIAQKTIRHLPESSAVYTQLQKLSSLCTFIPFSVADQPSDDDFSIDFSKDVDVIRAMMVASYPDNLLYGVRRCESFNDKEKIEAKTALELMNTTQSNVARTLVVSSNKKATNAMVEELAKVVMPNQDVDIKTFGGTFLLTLNHNYVTDPINALVHNLTGHSLVESQTQSSSKIVSSTLPQEMILFWQFGERRPYWKAGDMRIDFSPPQHPLATTWFRMTEEKERVQILSWRNPTGLVCDVDTNRRSLPLLAVACHMQGSGHRSFLLANHLCLLPSLHGGRNALLLALAFQHLSTNLNILVDHQNQQIVGLSLNSFSISPLPGNHVMDDRDLEDINHLRRAISRVFGLHSTQLSPDILSEVPFYLTRLLSHGRETPEDNYRCEDNSLWEWEIVMGERDELDTDISGDEEEEEEKEQEVVEERGAIGGGGGRTRPDPIFEYLPEFKCSLLHHRASQEESVSHEVTLQTHVQDTTRHLTTATSITTTASASDTESESRRTFQLSPNAPEFVPTLPPDVAPQVHSHSDTDDQLSSDYCSTVDDTEHVSRMSLPSNSLSVLMSSGLIGPNFIQSISRCPVETQRSVWENLSQVGRCLQQQRSSAQPQGIVEQLEPVPSKLQSAPPTIPAYRSSRQQQSHQNRPYYVREVVGPVPHHHIKGPPPHSRMTTSPRCESFSSSSSSRAGQGLSHLATTSGRSNLYRAASSGKSTSQSCRPPPPPLPMPPRGRSTERPISPQFPHAYPTVGGQSHLICRPGRVRSIPPPVTTSHVLPSPRVPVSQTGRVPLFDPPQSKLDLSLRAPGSGISGGYTTRYPALPLPRPSFPRPSFPRSPVLPSYPTLPPQNTENVTASNYPPSPPHSVESHGVRSTPTTTTQQNSPPQSVFHLDQTQYYIICKSLLTYILTHLQEHAGPVRISSLLKQFIHETGLPWELGGVLLRNLPQICREGKIVMTTVGDNDVLVSLPQATARDVVEEKEYEDREDFYVHSTELTSEPSEYGGDSVIQPPPPPPPPPPAPADQDIGGEDVEDNMTTELGDSEVVGDTTEPRDSEVVEDTTEPGDSELVEDTTEPGDSEVVEDTTEPGDSEVVEDTTEPRDSELVEDTAEPGDSELVEDTTEPGDSEVVEDTTEPGDSEVVEDTTEPQSHETNDTKRESSDEFNVNVGDDKEEVEEAQETTLKPVDKEPTDTDSVNQPTTEVLGDTHILEPLMIETIPTISTEEKQEKEEEEGNEEAGNEEAEELAVEKQEEEEEEVEGNEEKTSKDEIRKAKHIDMVEEESSHQLISLRSAGEIVQSDHQDHNGQSLKLEDSDEEPKLTVHDLMMSELEDHTSNDQLVPVGPAIDTSPSSPDSIEQETLNDSPAEDIEVKEVNQQMTVVVEGNTLSSVDTQNLPLPTEEDDNNQLSLTNEVSLLRPHIDLTISEEHPIEVTPPPLPTTEMEVSPQEMTVDEVGVYLEDREADQSTEAGLPLTKGEEITNLTTTVEHPVEEDDVVVEDTPPLTTTEVEMSHQQVAVDDVCQEMKKKNQQTERSEAIIEWEIVVEETVTVETQNKEDDMATPLAEATDDDQSVTAEEEERVAGSIVKESTPLSTDAAVDKDATPPANEEVKLSVSQSEVPSVVSQSEVSQSEVPSVVVESEEAPDTTTGIHQVSVENETDNLTSTPTLVTAEVTVELSPPTPPPSPTPPPIQSTETKSPEKTTVEPLTPPAAPTQPVSSTVEPKNTDTSQEEKGNPAEYQNFTELEFLVACLQFVNGHSHTWKLGAVYRAQYKTDALINMRAIDRNREFFNLRGAGCVHMAPNADLDSIKLKLNQLSREIKTLLRELRDYCPILRRNLGGTRDLEECRVRRHTERMDVSTEPRPSRPRKGRRSLDLRPQKSKRESVFESPRFPKDVKSARDPGHICHILKFYENFFSKHTEPVLYSTLLQEYIATYDLPGDFYLPSDLLRYNFDVFRKNRERFIRPKYKTRESSPPPLPTKKESKKEVTEKIPGQEKPKRSRKRSIKKLTSVEPVKNAEQSLESEDQREQEKFTSSKPRTSRPNTVLGPDNWDHMLAFYTRLFEETNNPIPLNGFSVRYLKAYNVPLGSRLPYEFFGKHFKTFHIQGQYGKFVCPRSWSWVDGTRQVGSTPPAAAADIAPTTTPVHEIPVTEVWGEEEEVVEEGQFEEVGVDEGEESERKKKEVAKKTAISGGESSEATHKVLQI